VSASRRRCPSQNASNTEKDIVPDAWLAARRQQKSRTHSSTFRAVSASSPCLLCASMSVVSVCRPMDSATLRYGCALQCTRQQRLRCTSVIPLQRDCAHRPQGSVSARKSPHHSRPLHRALPRLHLDCRGRHHHLRLCWYYGLPIHRTSGRSFTRRWNLQDRNTACCS
jgi:hypothetical protein